MFNRKLVALATAVVLSLACAQAADFPTVGEKAPGFKLTSQAGKSVSLADYEGQWVVLYFYPKDFTSGCTLQARNFQRDAAKYAERKAVVVGVSVDSADSHKSFCEKEGLGFTLLSDPDATVSTAYNSVMDFKLTKVSSRNTFLIDPKGNVARVFPQVKPAQHSDEVLAAIDELRK